MTDSSPPPSSSIPGFVRKWRGSGSEKSNKDLFLDGLCRALGVPSPRPVVGDSERDDFVFEKPVRVSREGKLTPKYIDLYRRGSFVLEAKQGCDADTGKLGKAKRGTPGWNVVMNAAFGQALEYASFLDEPPPFIIVADLGYCFDIYASFDGTARYRPFPNAVAHRIHLSELEKHREKLRAIFLDPLSLDPSKIAIEVTREVAAHLAELTRRLEKAGNAPNAVADFLMRCLFTMFAEDVGLLPDEIFTKELRDHWVKLPRSFPGGVENLWRAMNDGSAFGFFGKLLHFNGGLFKSPSALPLDKKDLEVLLEAAKCRWNKVEPAIFGALFEGALDKKERQALGAHFTPRSYVERLVRPTLEEPLREDWSATQAKIRELAAANKLKDAKVEARAFMKRLSEVRVLDPACGTANFLYVSLDLMKAIEDEAFALLLALEGGQADLCLDAPEVTPKQFLGIEINPRAKAIAELVLWIGYLQWHFRTKHRGGKPREPVLEDYKNVECRDAVLAYDERELRRDKAGGKPLTRWDGETMRRHPATGALVPDPRFTAPIYDYTNPRPAPWPAADFIVGNPPFVGNKRMRAVLGDGYVQALRATYPSVPETADYVMYWWNRSAQSVVRGQSRRFGLITTNSITQTFNRAIVAEYLERRGLTLAFAVPDHPWVDSADGAAVRIAMSVGCSANVMGRVLSVVRETTVTDGSVAIDLHAGAGKVLSDLSIGAATVNASRLKANERLAYQGMALCGEGFVLTHAEGDHLRSRAAGAGVIRRYRNGKDLTQKSRNVFVIDFFGKDEAEAREAHPQAFQIVLDRVKPERDLQRREHRRRKYWLFGETVAGFRQAVSGLDRYIATCRTAKHRAFMFLDGDILPDAKIIAIALDASVSLAVLSSRAHRLWALRTGAFLEDRPNYNHSDCFGTFPFPAVTAAQQRQLGDLAESIDRHRKRQQAEHPSLTITSMYNVLDKLDVGEPLDAEDRVVHEQGLLSVLKALHDDLDRAVGNGYGWPDHLGDEEIVERLVALNAERAEEERNGFVRWLRPEFQKPPSTGQARPGIAKVKVDSIPSDPPGPSVRHARPRTAVTKRKASKR